MARTLYELQKVGESRLSVCSEPMRQWAGSIVLAIAVAIVYFLASPLSLFLRTNPDDVVCSVQSFLLRYFPSGGKARRVSLVQV